MFPSILLEISPSVAPPFPHSGRGKCKVGGGPAVCSFPEGQSGKQLTAAAEVAWELFPTG